MKSVVIFTDGSSRGNPGPGGYGAIVFYNDTVREIGGYESLTTNNRMEMMSVIVSLKYLVRENINDSVVTINSDSSYLLNGISKWIYGWLKNDFKNKDGEQIKNEDLWREINELENKLKKSGNKIVWNKVSGHSGVAGNERVDEIATAFSDGAGKSKPELFFGNKKDYKIDITNFSVDVEKSDTKKLKNSSKNKKAYSYVSYVDGRIYYDKTWPECEKRVKGKSGAKFKKAISKIEEEIIAKDFTQSL